MKSAEAILSHGELRALIDLNGLNVQGSSPLKPVMESPAQGDRGSFARRGLLSDDWHSALCTLCGPRFEARSLVTFADATAVNVFYSDGSAEGALVACREEGDRVRIAFPIEPSQVARADADALHTSHAPTPETGAVSMSLEAFNVLAAAVDALRAVLLTSILWRAAVPELVFRYENLKEMLQSGIDSADARWLVTLLRVLAPPRCEPMPLDLDNGYRELLRLELLSEDGHGIWRPSQTLQRMAAYWKVPLPAGAHQTVSLRPKGTQQYRGCVTLRGDGPLWVVDYEGIGVEDASPRVRLRSVDRDVWFMEILGMLTPQADMPRQASRRTAPNQILSPAGLPETVAPVKPEPAGKPAPSSPPDTCAQCGVALRSGARFCTQCGSVRGNPSA